MAWATQAALTNAAAPSRVQGTTVNVAASGGTLSPALTGIAQGNVLILTVVDSSNITTSSSVTNVSGAGATWSQGPHLGGTIGTLEIWYGVNATGSGGSQTVTVTLQGSDTAGCQLDEWTNIENVSGASDTRHPPYTVGGTSTSPSITPVAGRLNEVVYVGSWTANTETANPGAPYNTLVGPTTGGNQKAGIAYWVSNTLTNTAATWTQASGTWNTAALVLKPIEVPTFQEANVIDEQAIAQALAGSGAVLDGCAVGPNTGADFKFQVAAGTILNGNTSVAVSALTAQTITAADATNPRRDLVYVVSATGAIKYVAGTPAINPAAPYLPNDCSALCVINIPANATTVTTANFFDIRVVLRLPNAGWMADTNAWSFSTSTAATATSVASVNNDATQYLQLGDRIQLTNNGITQYFIVTNIGLFNGANTLVTLYGGNVPVYLTASHANGGGAVANLGVGNGRGGGLDYAVPAGSTLQFTNGDTAVTTAGAAAGASNIVLNPAVTPSATGGGWFSGQAVACTNYILANSAITAVSYSHQKTPFGFNVDEALWTQIMSDSQNRLQATPTSGTWYNPGALQLLIPLGAWQIAYQAECYAPSTAASNNIQPWTTLSTTTNSETDHQFTSGLAAVASGTSLSAFIVPSTARKYVRLTSAATYYLLCTYNATGGADIGFTGGATSGQTSIWARCAYL
jgi:hypothetical protein